MPLTFYPATEDLLSASIPDQITVLMDAAERYRVALQDLSAKAPEATGVRSTPRDLHAAYNWEVIASVLRHIRELPEASKDERQRKADLLTKLSEVYEVLRSAKMSKLEAVRLALIGEANQLRGAT
jgi:hypothetical protein